VKRFVVVIVAVASVSSALRLDATARAEPTRHAEGGTAPTVKVDASLASGCTITSSDPPNCAIDARIVSDLEVPGVIYGWDTLELTVTDCSPENLGVLDFVVTTTDGIPAPEIVSVTSNGVDTAILHLSAPIAPRGWTCFSHGSLQKICLGFLPGNVDHSNSTNAADVLKLLEHMEGSTNLEMWQCDVNRSGGCTPDDLIRLIDLLNGCDESGSWYNATIWTACPSAPP